MFPTTKPRDEVTINGGRWKREASLHSRQKVSSNPAASWKIHTALGNKVGSDCNEPDSRGGWWPLWRHLPGSAGTDVSDKNARLLLGSSGRTLRGTRVKFANKTRRRGLARNSIYSPGASVFLFNLSRRRHRLRFVSQTRRFSDVAERARGDTSRQSGGGRLPREKRRLGGHSWPQSFVIWFRPLRPRLSLQLPPFAATFLPRAGRLPTSKAALFVSPFNFPPVAPRIYVGNNAPGTSSHDDASDLRRGGIIPAREVTAECPRHANACSIASPAKLQRRYLANYFVASCGKDS